jgi:hypothetical protein
LTQKLLKRRQASWSEFLIQFDYDIVYRPGKSYGKADALTKRLQDLHEGGDERLKNMEQVVLKQHNLPEQFRILALVAPACVNDPLQNRIMKAIRQGDSLKDITIEECTEQEGQVWYRGKRYVPKGDQLRLQLIQEDHDTALAGHLGRAKTFDLRDKQ